MSFNNNRFGSFRPLGILTILSILIIFSKYSWAAEVNLSPFPLGGKIEVEVIEVVYGDLDVFTLIMPIEVSRGRDIYLLCSFNPFYETLKSYLVVSHDSIYRGVRFTIDDNSCLKVFSFLKANYEIVNPEHPIRISFDLDKMEVKKIEWKDRDSPQTQPTPSLTNRQL